MAAMIDTFAKAWVDAHDNASKEAANQLGVELMWSMISVHAANRLREAAGRCDVGDVEAGEAATLPWVGVIEAAQQSQQLLRSNVNLGLVCDHLVAQMSGALIVEV
jgi:hypothetical protein